MGFPEIMDDEALAVFGFATFEDDPKKAYNILYPKLSFRHKCDDCGLWNSLIGNEESMLCKHCFIGRKRAVQSNALRHLYSCCGSRDCPAWQNMIALFRKTGVAINNRNGGYGLYVEMIFPDSWTTEQRVAIHMEINEFSVSKLGSRKMTCQSSKTSGSKLPTVSHESQS